eukprot:14831493-Alexandrium_andersonii.AAC.1
MGVGALEPEPAELDPESPDLQVALAVLQGAFCPGKGRGKGGKPTASDAPGGSVIRGGAKSTGKGVCLRVAAGSAM